MTQKQPDFLTSALKEVRSGLPLLALFSFFINILVLTSPIYMMQTYDRVHFMRTLLSDPPPR